MGPDMCIDEKYIGGEFYTLADKFHILQHLFDAVQSIRIYHRNVYLTKRRQAYEAFKAKEAERKIHCQSMNETFHPAVFQHKEERLENGETNRELLARSVHLLYKFSGQWNSSQSKRAEILFKHYPDIHTAYKLCCSFREWYSKEYIGQPIKKIRKRLDTWFNKVKATGMEEMLNFKSLVERHLGVILNYFNDGRTNANAESLNAKIQRFLQANNGSRDLDFTFFRLTSFFA